MEVIMMKKISISISTFLLIASFSQAALIHQWKLDETALTWNGSTWGNIIDSVSGNPTGLLWGYAVADTVNTTVINQPGVPLYAGDLAYNFTEPTGISAAFLNNNTAVPTTGDFTALVWMKTTNLHTAEGHLFSNNNAQAGRANLTVLNGALRWFQNGGVSLADATAEKGAIFDGNWHEVGISRKGSLFALLRDGQVVASASAAGAAAFSINTSWMIARMRSYGGDFDGSVADVKVYNTDYSLVPVRAWNPTPVNSAADVSTSTALQWNTAMDPNNPANVNPKVTKHYLYLVDTEPNFVGVTPITIAAGSPPDVTKSYPVTLGTDKTYYWRVDESINNSSTSDPNTIRGFAWSFATVKSVPVITDQPDDVLLNTVGETAQCVIAVTSISHETYYWYKSADNANDTPGDDTAVGTNSDTLIINNAQVSNEGYYFCKVTNAGGQALSNVAKLGIKQLMAHWTLDQAKFIGNQYADETGNHNADPNNPAMVSFVAGKKADAVQMGNEGAWARAGSWRPNAYTNQMTVSAWFKLTGTASGDGQGIVSKRDDGGSGGFDWAMYVRSGDGSHTGSNYVRFTSWAAGDVWAGPNAVVSNEWVYVVAVVDASNAGRVYINGLENAVDSSWGFGPNAAAQILLGKGTPTTSLLPGQLDDVKIYNYALSDLDVAVMYTTDDPTKTVCLPSQRPDAKYDRDGNCKVDLADFAVFAGDWLNCGLIPQSACN
jgi:hypothetical protein